MEQYPKWLLALAFPCLLPVLLSIFFLFGGLRPFGRSEHIVVDFILFLAANLLWILPVLLFFAGLYAFGRTYERLSIGLLTVGMLLTALDIWLVMA